jgi:hypothetical protein
MLMNREGYVILWEFFVRFPDIIEHDLDAIIEALCMPTSAVRMTGLAAMVVVEGGLNLLLYMLRFYPLLQTNGERIIQTLLEAIVNEKRQKSWVPMLELFHNPKGSKVLFHLYYYHAELMEQYVVKISELLVRNSSFTQIHGGALYQIIDDPEDELSGNSVLLALSRNFNISTLLYHLSQSELSFFEGATDAVAQAICQVVTGSVGRGESALGWMACNNELCGILLSMVSYMSMQAQSEIRKALSSPCPGFEGVTIEAILSHQTHGMEVLKVINPPPGLFERVALRVRSSFRLASVPENPALVTESAPPVPQSSPPVSEDGGDSDQEGLVPEGYLPEEYLEVVSMPF